VITWRTIIDTIVILQTSPATGKSGEYTPAAIKRGPCFALKWSGDTMITGIFLVFICGWLAWFWIDKPPVGQFGLPPPGDSMVEDFQRSVDLLKTGHPDMAYLYVWHAHYLILSVVFGILVAVAFRTMADHLSRVSRRRRYYPPTVAGTSHAGRNVPTERPLIQTNDDKISANDGSSDQPVR
jgi:hypothetical protein